MSYRMFGVFCLICLLVNPGMCIQKWEVNYVNKMQCALKGSTTHLSGSFTFPEHLTLSKVFWTVDLKGNVRDLYRVPEYEGRVGYILSANQTFLLKLSNVTYEDEKMYCIRIVTDEEKGKYLGYPGIELKVTELKVLAPEEVIEGNSAVLSCKSTCDFANSTKYIWYKNKLPLSESFSRKELFLYSVSSDDTGEYSCALREREDLPSPAVTLNVRYPPKKVSASISSSGVIVEGDSVNLTCSSESNPPVHIYSWFKDNQTSSVGSGQTFSISNFNSRLSGWFYCVAQNKHGSQRSAAVLVTVTAVNMVMVGVILVVVMTSVILMVAVVMFIRRKRVMTSGKHEQVVAPESAYMTLDLTSRCADYDTLHNMKISSDLTSSTEAQDPLYYNVDTF